MAESNPYAGPRWLAFLLAAIAVVTLIAAALNTPIGEWSGTSYLFGAVLIFFAAAFAISGIRGSFNLTGRLSAKASVIVGVLGAVASLFVIVSSFIAGDWNVSNILTTGIWIALLLMFAGTIVVGRAKMAAG